MGEQRPSHPLPPVRSVRLGRHDRLQAELKVEYPVHDVLQAAAAFELDIWLHLPADVGIGPERTGAESVYQDLRVQTRLKTPSVHLRDLADPRGKGSPLVALAVLVDAPEQTPAWARDVRREARLAARVLRSSGRRVLAAAGRHPDRARELMGLMLETCRVVGPRFRALAQRLRALPLDPPTALCLEATDEYLSLQTELLCTRAVALLDQVGVDGALRAGLAELARREDDLRRDRHWRSRMPAGHDAVEDEPFLDQAGLLKRYVERVLILRPVPSRVQRFAHDTILGLAAALAMSWAVGLQVFALYSLDLDLSRGAGTSIVVAFSTIAVLGYILKDRIKAWSAEVLARQLPRFLDDRGFLLTWGIQATVLGRVSERLKFIPAERLDPEVHRRHEAAMGTPLAAEVHDDVLHYRRRVVLQPRAALAVFPRFVGVNDTIRLNVARWVRTLSAPHRSIVVLDDQDRPVERRLPNRYSVPVVTRLRSRDASGHPHEEWAVHRILLTQRGVVRVDALGQLPEEDREETGAFM